MAEQIRIENLPDLVSGRLNLQEYIDGMGEVVEKFKLNDEQEKKLVQLGKNVVLKELPVSGFWEKVKSDLGLDDVKAKELAGDFIGLQLLPLQDYLGDVTGEIKKLGGDLDKYLQRADKLLQPDKLLWDNVAQAWGEADFNIDEVSKEQRKNYFNIIINLLQQKAKPEDLAGIMAQPMAQGGLGVEQKQAEIIAEWTDNLVAAGDISLQHLKELDEARKKVLGDRFTSVLEVQPIKVISQTQAQSNKLTDEFKKFLDQPEVRQVMREVEQFTLQPASQPGGQRNRETRN